jgi:tetratricopeptide (TPR) repeat protein
MKTARIGGWAMMAAMLGMICLASRVASAPGACIRTADEAGELRQKALSLNDITGDDPIDAQVKELASDPAGTKKLLAVAVKMAQEKDQPFNFTGAIILAKAADSLKDTDSALVLYRVCASESLRLRSADKIVQAYLRLSQLLTQQKKYDEEIKLWQEVLELKDAGGNLGGIKILAFRQMIGAKALQGKIDEARKLVEKLDKAAPGNWLTLDLRAQVERMAGKYDDAAKYWEEALDRIQKDESIMDKEAKAEFVREIRFKLSVVYVDANQLDKGTAHLKTVLDQDPDDPQANNDLGYIWADHDMNLDEAEKMIRKALDQDRKRRKKDNPDLKPEDDKDNAAYLDSLGWVLFKKKKFQEAKEPMLKAIKEKDGQHVEIYDHLGEIHMALGEKADAIAIWKEALKLETEEAREKEIKAKVQKKLNEAAGEKK